MNATAATYAPDAPAIIEALEAGRTVRAEIPTVIKIRRWATAEWNSNTPSGIFCTGDVGCHPDRLFMNPYKFRLMENMRSFSANGWRIVDDDAPEDDDTHPLNIRRSDINHYTSSRNAIIEQQQARIAELEATVELLTEPITPVEVSQREIDMYEALRYIQEVSGCHIKYNVAAHPDILREFDKRIQEVIR